MADAFSTNWSKNRPLPDTALEHVLRDDGPLDLARPLEDLDDPLVAVVALHREVLGVPHAPVDLHRLVDDVVGRLGAEELHDGGLPREVVPPLPRACSWRHGTPRPPSRGRSPRARGSSRTRAPRWSSLGCPSYRTSSPPCTRASPSRRG